MKNLITKLAGVTFNDHQQNIKLFGNGPELGIGEYDLVREPDNPYDQNAVQVCFGNFSLGYLPKNVARIVAPLMDAGKNLVAKFVSLNRSPYHDQVGLTVKIIELTT
jgi:hypothetical protein